MESEFAVFAVDLLGMGSIPRGRQAIGHSLESIVTFLIRKEVAIAMEMFGRRAIKQIRCEISRVGGQAREGECKVTPLENRI